MKLHEHVTRRWQGETVFIVASGPSLTPQVVETLKGIKAGARVICVNDAYKLVPFADVLYACDASWWNYHNGCPDFVGEKWSSHEKRGSNNKQSVAEKYGLNLVLGRTGDMFGTDHSIFYGGNSGFQAVNLAILFGAARLPLVAFDMRDVKGKSHFFGDHKKPLRVGKCYQTWIDRFNRAAKRLPSGVTIVNTTPGSALKCFPFERLEEEARYGDGL